MARQFRLARETSTPFKRVGLGLISGICNSTDIDPAIVRLVLLISIVFYGIGLGLYFIIWLFAFVLFGYDEQ